MFVCLFFPKTTVLLYFVLFFFNKNGQLEKCLEPSDRKHKPHKHITIKIKMEKKKLRWKSLSISKAAELHFNSMFNERSIGQPDMWLIVKGKKWKINVQNIINNVLLKIVTKTEDIIRDFMVFQALWNEALTMTWVSVSFAHLRLAHTCF